MTRGCRVLMHSIPIDSKVKRLTGSQLDGTLLRLLLLFPDCYGFRIRKITNCVE